MREAIRVRHYSLRTERAYVHWIRRYVLFHGKRHPVEMGGEHVTAFLSHLATAEGVSAATQNQALAALLFLYKNVLGVELPWLAHVVRAKAVRRVPTVLERDEVQALLERMHGDHALMARLMYGTGMRIGECVAIRIKELNLERRLLVVRDGKGGKDRVTMVPRALLEPLRGAVERSRLTYERDRLKDRPGVELPFALERKYPNAGKMWGWHWLFPQGHVSIHPRSGLVRRHGTTMIYTHVLNRGGRGVVSPLDR